MLLLPYISTPVAKKVSLAEESWDIFSPFLGRYQWAFDDPAHSPRAVEIASAILKRGQKGACTFQRPGYKYILPVLQARHFDDAIARRRKIYYVSYGSQALLYFDIDLHYAWQTVAHGQHAQEKLDGLLRKFFGGNILFWSQSSRGINGYLKVDVKGMDPALANELFDRLEAALQLFLASCDCPADFEVKGTIGHMQDGQYRWGRYGKLPIHQSDWSFDRLDQFVETPTVSIHGLKTLCGIIEAQVPQDVLRRLNQIKKARGDEPLRQEHRFLVTPAIEKMLLEKHGESWRYKFSMLWGSGDDTWLHERYYRAGRAPLTDHELRKEEDDSRHIAQAYCAPELPGGTRRSSPYQPAESGTGTAEVRKEHERHLQRDLPASVPVARKRGPVNLDCSDLVDEPDSYERQKQALFRYARYLKRVPTFEEGMDLIHDKILFTGTWEENFGRREARVRTILKMIADTFDAVKCGNGHVNVGKYDTWAENRFPDGLVGGYKRDMDENGDIVDFCQNIHVSAKFIASFMAVAEFGLLIDKNQDGTLPHRRAEELWKELYARGLISVKFDSRKWAVCREELVKYDIITITDRNYHTGKAMGWDVGIYFPGLGLWKGTKLVSLPVSMFQRKRTTTEGLNTLLHSQPAFATDVSGWRLSRPPP